MTAPKFNEKDLLIRFATDLGESGTFIDIGAHIGTFSAGFATLGWRVVAVEAAPEIFEEMAQRLAEFPNVTPIHAAATELGGAEVEFFISSEFWGIHSLRPFDESHDRSVKVSSLTLADIHEPDTASGPQIIKVDAEGSDLFVLRGGSWEGKKPELVMCEFMDNRTLEHFGYGFRDIIAYMEPHGYVTYISEWTEVEEHSRRGVKGPPFTHIQVLASPLAHEPAWGNLIFVTTDLRNRFEQALTAYTADVRRVADETLARISEDERQLKNMKGALHNRERTIASLESLAAQRSQRIEELTNAIKQRDTRAQELTNAIKQRDTRTQELTNAIKQRDTRTQELESRLKRVHEEKEYLKLKLARVTDSLRRQKLYARTFGVSAVILLCALVGFTTYLMLQ